MPPAAASASAASIHCMRACSHAANMSTCRSGAKRVQGFAADSDAADATHVSYALQCRPATCFEKGAKLCVPIYKPSKFFIGHANGTVQYAAARTSHANCSCNGVKKGDESTLLQRPKLRSAAGVMCPTSPLSLSASHWSLMAAARAVRQREATAWRNSAFCRHGVKVSKAFTG